MQIRKVLRFAAAIVLALASHASLAQKSSTTKSITTKVVGVNDYGKVELTALSIAKVNDADFVDGRMVQTEVVGVIPHGTFTNTSGKAINSVAFTVRIKVCEYSPLDCLEPYVTVPGGYAAYPNVLPSGGVGKVGGGRTIKNLPELQFIKKAISGELPIDLIILDIVYADGTRQVNFAPAAQQKAERDAIRERQAKIEADRVKNDDFMTGVRDINRKYANKIGLQGFIGKIISDKAIKDRDAELNSWASENGRIYDKGTGSFEKIPGWSEAPLPPTRSPISSSGISSTQGK